ncbi:MAG: sulfatase-like hydrolase/transferase [Prolixibacteraceae bacterium]|jgi:arylsulfatase A-like enzyme|nr:sulfatase-like hydrolase/transferase [Prolixibacteraceae bacterium]
MNAKPITIAMSAMLLLSSATEKVEKPNLVFIFSDQQTFDMVGCYGNKQIKTPNLDEFSKQGVRFTHCFSNSPICTPFRGLLMSGQQSLYNGAFVNDKPLVPGHGKKFAEVLRDAGYNTAYIGKWHLLGGERDRPIPKGEMRYGFDELFESNNCHVDFRAGKCFYWSEEGQKVFFDKWEVYGQTDQASEYLESRKTATKPFALFVSWHAPHDLGKFRGADGLMHYQYDAPEELMAMYNRDSIQMRPGIENTPDHRRMVHGQMAMTTGVDIAFGQIMEKLRKLKLDKNTIVVFTSDHGDMLDFDDAVYPKQYPHDYSCHTPFLLRWPGKIRLNATTGLLFSAMDIMPSILGLMGLDVPKECHGKNLCKAILDNDENAVDYVPIWLYEGKGSRGVITRDFTFSTQKDATEGSLHSVLFDRNNDPFQLNNLFANPKMAEVKEKLSMLTQQWMTKYNDKFWEEVDFMKVATPEQWDNPPYIRPVDVLK